jgi:predicted HAD superfamily Cof-like phosphohydrolase
MTLKETIEAVETFHNAFGIENNYTPTTELTEAEILLRYKLMREENEEYLEAAQNGDIVEIADALGDQLYILCGTILKHGLQHKIAEVFQEIQRSNMSKLDAEGKPIYREDGKVMKSELYFKPNIKSILEAKDVRNHFGNR